MPGADPVGLSICDLGVSFDGGSHVLDGFAMDVRPSQVVALVGASGCGKSTLLRAIAGLQAYQSGTIRFFGQAATGSEAIQPDVPTSLSFVFQDATLLPWRTVFENVVLPLDLQANRSSQTLSAQDRHELVASVLTAVELGESAWRMFPRQLSGGMKMRTSIARALVTQPSVLLLDEPFAALDDLLRTKLNQLLLRLWQSRQPTILFVTHNIAEAVWLSHRIAVFGKGKLSKMIDNPLPWPRTAQQRSSLEFAQLYGTISGALAEVNPS